MLNNLRSSKEFNELAQLISDKAQGRNIVYAPAYGNWGDALIHKGVQQFLDHFKFKYTTIERPKIDAIRETLAPTGIKLEDSVLLNCGGGSWCKNFHGTRDFVTRNHGIFSETIVMPSTYELDAVPSTANNISYIARDQENSLQSIPSAQFCHDMAFFIELPKPLDKGAEAPIGYFMREDRERSGSAGSFKSSFDISLLGNQRSKITPFFQILNNYKEIVTDRMHVAIAGAMLGKEVKLYSSDYFKAPAVYRTSMLNNYSNVELVEW